LETGSLLLDLKEQPNRITDIVATADGHYVVSSRYERTFSLFDLALLMR
jgi:hypothetical protein